MFTIPELKNLQILLDRVDIKGNEAIFVANIQIKISNMMKVNSVLDPKPEEIKVEEEVKDNNK